MQPNREIDPALLDNAGDFTEAFFRRFALRHAPRPLQLTPQIAKDYLFPTLYGDVTCAMAVFMCSYDRASHLMLHPKMKPVRMPRGRALVLLSCVEYRKVLGVAPYNEVAMTIPVLLDPLLHVPVLPMLLGTFRSFGYHVFGMPVTSLENRIRGREIWGLPKVVQQVDIVEDGGDCVTTCREDSGEPYLTLRVPMHGTPTELDLSSNLYTRLGDRLLHSRTSLKATFNVRKRMGLLLRTGVAPDREYLTLGDGPSAEILHELEIERCPFQLRFAKGMTSAFDLPHAEQVV